MSYNFEQVCEFNIGDEYWESSQYGNIHFEVITKPVVDDGQVSFMAQNLDDETHTYKILMTEGFEHYGPKIYDFPAYANFNILRTGDK